MYMPLFLLFIFIHAFQVPGVDPSTCSSTIVTFCTVFLLFLCRIFPPPSQSYYCLLKVGSHGGEGEGELRQYLVCFLSIGKEGLDLYPLVNLA